MLRTYILLTIRNFLRNKTAFIINVLGMGIALGICITSYVNYEFNAGFDKQQTGIENIYRISFVNESEGKETLYGVTPMPMPELIRVNFPEVNNVIRYISKNAMFRIGDEMFQKEFIYADPDFTKTFTIPIIHGTPDLRSD